MKSWILFTLTIIGLNISASTYTGPNRIYGAENEVARCLGGVDETTCEQRRNFGLNKGCISREEYDILKRFGSFPICSDFGDGKGLELQSWCPCGCFHPDTAISVETSDPSSNTLESALDITKNKQNFRVVHLAKDASISNFVLKSTPIKMSTSGLEEKPLIVIRTSDDRILKVTEKHPLLTARGEMVLASELNIDDGLIDQDGFKVEIASLSSEMFEGEVVNFMIDEPIESRLEHVIFANRIAVGDLAWQSSLEDEQQQVIIRQ